MERTSPLETSRDMLRRFAEIVERDGIERVNADLLTELLAAGRAVEASAVAMAVVVDPTEPAVVRERAFHKLTIQIIGRSDRASVSRRLAGTVTAIESAGSVDRRHWRPATVGAA